MTLTLTNRFQCIEEKCLQDQKTWYGRFFIGPFYPGQSITLANALRRSLLSELEGTTITSIRFLDEDGLPLEKIHDFSTIPGIRESVFDLILNIKEILLYQKSKEETFEPQKAQLTLRGTGVIRADSIQFPNHLELVNPDQYITTILSPDVHVHVELLIERGKDLTANQEKTGPAFGNIPIEALFAPVKKVKYFIEDYKIAGTEHLKKERILLEVWTNGSLLPEEAIRQAAQSLINLFSLLLEPSKQIEPVKKSQPSQSKSIESSTASLPRPKEDTLIEELDLSARSFNCLKRAQIHTVLDLLDYSKENLLEIKNFGKKSAEEVVEALQNRLGLSLPNE